MKITNKKTGSKLNILVLAITFIICACNEDTESRYEGASDNQGNKIGKNNTGVTSLHASIIYWSTDVGSPISYESAKRWTGKYVEKNPSGTQSHYFGKSSFSRIFQNPNCIGISISYGIDDEGNSQLLLAGVDKNGKILVQTIVPPGTAATLGSYEDASRPCPPFCPTLQ